MPEKNLSHHRHCFTREKRLYSFVKWGTFTNSENQKCWHKGGRMLPQCNVKKRDQKNPNLYPFNPVHICPHYICTLTHSLSDMIQIFQGEKLEISSCQVGLDQFHMGNMYVCPEVLLPPSPSCIWIWLFIPLRKQIPVLCLQTVHKCRVGRSILVIDDLSSVPFLVVSLIWEILEFSSVEQGIPYPKTVQWLEKFFPCLGGIISITVLTIHNNNIKKNYFLLKKCPIPFSLTVTDKKGRHLKLLHFIMFETFFSQEKEETKSLKILKN